MDPAQDLLNFKKPRLSLSLLVTAFVLVAIPVTVAAVTE